MEVISTVIARDVLSQVSTDIMGVMSVSYNKEQNSHNTLIQMSLLRLSNLNVDIRESDALKRL